jgi:hypothetical protein
MNGIVFEDQAPVVVSDPNRADIVLFVGFVERRNTRIPSEVRRWLDERGWTRPPYKRLPPPLIRRSQLKDPAGLLRRLADRTSPLSVYLLQRFSLEAPRLVEESRPAQAPSEARQRGLVIGLNGMLTGGPLYNAAAFEALPLADRTRAMLDQNLRGDVLIRLNRLLLEAVFPDELASTDSDTGSAPADELFDIPVPIDNWDAFDRLFAWERRDLDGRGAVGSTYLGAAVRSFFAQGGRKCYVVRVGDPWLLMASSVARLNRLQELIPGYPNALLATPADRESWQGVGHLFGLPDVSFVCLPDLADVIGADREEVKLPRYIVKVEEQFVECSEPQAGPPADALARLFRAPRCGEDQYQAWASAIEIVAEAIYRHQREVQLIASVPMPIERSAPERDLMEFFADKAHPLLSARLNGAPRGLASAFVQLVYPWARTPGSTNLPEQLEAPDAILAGMLARNALTRGAYFSAAGLHLADVFDVYPVLRRYQIRQAHPEDGNPAPSNVKHTLLERVSLFLPTPRGIELASDVTTSLDESYRPASINRLVSVIVRAARVLGEDFAFESSGEQLWSKLREALTRLLLSLWEEGALRGATPAEAFYVRCDRSTMTQNDIDNGRVIAQVQFDAAFPIERITVVLAMDEGGQVSLITTEAAKGEAA